MADRKIEFMNNFRFYEKDFTSDMGLPLKRNEALYMQYAQTRWIDTNHQMLFHMMNELINLPDDIVFNINNRGQ